MIPPRFFTCCTCGDVTHLPISRGTCDVCRCQCIGDHGADYVAAYAHGADVARRKANDLESKAGAARAVADHLATIARQVAEIGVPA